MCVSRAGSYQAIEIFFEQLWKTYGPLYPCRVFKKAVRQGRSEVRDAKNNERHVCGRARVGERPVS